jgi:hypothetical protein
MLVQGLKTRNYLGVRVYCMNCTTSHAGAGSEDQEPPGFESTVQILYAGALSEDQELPGCESVQLVKRVQGLKTRNYLAVRVGTRALDRNSMRVKGFQFKVTNQILIPNYRKIIFYSGPHYRERWISMDCHTGEELSSSHRATLCAASSGNQSWPPADRMSSVKVVTLNY